MDEDGESSSARDRVRARKQAVTPQSGYQLVEWDLLKPPAEQIVERSEWWLTLSDVSIPQSTEFSDWSVFDRYTRDYATPKFQDLPENPDPETVPETLTVIENGVGEDIRVALVRLRRIAENHPDSCEPAVDLLADRVLSDDIEVQAEILGIYRVLAEAEPALIYSGIDVLGAFLTPETDSRLRTEAVTVVARVADADPSVVTDFVPRIEVLLKDKTGEAEQGFRILARIANEHPEAVLPIVPTLIEYTEDASHANRIGALSVLGYLSKSYPNVARDVISTAHELLVADSNRVRANAAGLLADLAAQYPEDVRPIVPDAIELLRDEDGYARYNATSILARVAKHAPESVEPATDDLIAALNEGRAEARENACWALGYLKATAATESLTTRAEADSNERVRQVASWALDEIDST